MSRNAGSLPTNRSTGRSLAALHPPGIYKREHEAIVPYEKNYSTAMGHAAAANDQVRNPSRAHPRFPKGAI
jgi:hypothetical protein